MPKFYYPGRDVRVPGWFKVGGNLVKISMATGALVLISGFAMADTILENGGSPTFTNVPSNLATGLGSGIPYWDNHSGDFGGSNTANVGYFLTATGNFSSGTNYSPSQ